MKRRGISQEAGVSETKEANRPTSGDGLGYSLPRPAKLTIVETSSICSALSLAPEEATFLRWLRENGGMGTRSGKNWMSNDVRLVCAGYVTKNSADLNTVAYSLTESGEEALADYDAATGPNQFAMSEWPGERVGSKQTPSKKHGQNPVVPGYDLALRRLRSHLTSNG
jgi:hypothetical protein